MPTYDYFCEACDTPFEQFNKMSEAELPCSEPCPHCGREGSVKKQIASAPPIVSGVAGRSYHMPSGFRDVLKKVKQAHPLGHIQD